MLSVEERAIVNRVVKAHKGKLATYVRDAVMSAARADLAKLEPDTLAPAVAPIDERALAERVAALALQLMAERMLPAKKDQAEGSA